MPVNSIASTSCPAPPDHPAARSKRNWLGTIYHLADAFPRREFPSHARGAMQGEGVCASYHAGKNDNYLYSLNAQTCVIATLYNPESRKGAVIHFDRNIRSHIHDAVEAAMRKIGASCGAGNENIEATLSGGIWFMGGKNIGNPVKEELLRHGLRPSWDNWSFSPCGERNYGVVLDLRTGNVQAFEHRVGIVEELQTPLLEDTASAQSQGLLLSPEQQRADAFMKRVEAPAIVEHADGELRFVKGNQRPPMTEEISGQRIPIHDLD
jgi:hypothetical protein